jgi:hypothetical protein
MQSLPYFYALITSIIALTIFIYVFLTLVDKIVASRAKSHIAHLTRKLLNTQQQLQSAEKQVRLFRAELAKSAKYYIEPTDYTPSLHHPLNQEALNQKARKIIEDSPLYGPDGLLRNYPFRTTNPYTQEHLDIDFPQGYHPGQIIIPKQPDDPKSE